MTEPASAASAPVDRSAADYSAYVSAEPGGQSRLHLLVEGIHCGGCVAKIERALARQPGIAEARVNLSTRRLNLAWQGGAERAAELASVVSRLGFPVVPFDPDRLTTADAEESRTLLRAMAVAGFAAANVMLLSVSVWAGHFQDMGPATRDLLHWFSALIALPAIAYAGLPFFRSAARALASGGLNMDAYSFWAVTEGGAPLGTDMPAFAEVLTEEERWQVLLYIANGFSSDAPN